MTDAAGFLSFAVEYDLPSRPSNPHFKGAGTLEIRPEGPTYVFSGIERGLIGRNPAVLAFQPADIVNVTVRDRSIQFKTWQGQAGDRGELFTFHLADAALARDVAARLPQTVEQEDSDARDFAAKLAAVEGDYSPWTSVTNLLIAANGAGFVLLGLLGAGWIETASMRPYVQFAANNGAVTTQGEWWRLLTAMFSHYGLIHLLLNMWALFQAGHFMERLLGRAAFAVMYFAAGLAGGFASILWHGDQTWSAGASGAVFGVYGSLLGYMLRERQGLPRTIVQSLTKSTVLFAFYNLVFGLASPGIDNAAHLGGFGGGLVFGWLLALPLDPAVRAREMKGRLLVASVVLVALVAAGVAFTPRFV
jgi:rhomboid protease GluP